MNAFKKLKQSISNKNNLLCVGLDPNPSNFPNKYSKDAKGIIEFNKMIIESTKEFAVSYKLNFAFYERFGVEGYKAIESTLEMIPEDIFTIADAKRGDIGNTSKAYADSVFKSFSFDSVTVAPYMGYDSIGPFLDYKEKIVFVLALTSNPSAEDFQKQSISNKYLFEEVLEKSSQWASHENLGYVVGATKADELKEIRSNYPDRIFLIPGLGAQGGDAEASLNANAGGPALFNVSRGIIAPKEEGDFRSLVKEKAKHFSNLLRVSNDSNSGPARA